MVCCVLVYFATITRKILRRKQRQTTTDALRDNAILQQNNELGACLVTAWVLTRGARTSPPLLPLHHRPS